MKRITRLMAMLLAIVMLVSSISLTAFATGEKEEDKKEDKNVAYVWNEETNVGEEYESISEAWAAACAGNMSISMLKDWKTTEVLTVQQNGFVTIYMNGHTIDRGLTNAVDSGEVFLVRDGAVLKIYGGEDVNSSEIATTASIKGGYNQNGGGGIHIQKDAKVCLYGVTVTENKTAEASGGGGVRLQGEKSKLEMNAVSFIKNNSAPNGVGGGISMRGEGAGVTGGNITDNTALDNGGGVSIHASGCSVLLTNIKNNKAGTDKKGGGIYMAQGSGASVSGCTVESNTAKLGGGIYVDGNGGSLAHSEIKKNTAELGGGVYIDVGDTLNLSGDITVSDNVSSVKNEAAKNMFLATTSDNEAYVSGYPSEGELHIGWDKDVRKGDVVKISKDKAKYVARYFVCDVEGYKLYWSWETDDEKNDRLLRASSTDYGNEADFEKLDVDQTNRYTVYKDLYKEKYDLQEGIFTYRATTGGELDATYYYSDGYFDQKPEEYNEHLATMSLSMAMAAFNMRETEFDSIMHNNGYANRFRNAKLLFSDIGVKYDNIYVSDTYTTKPTESSIAVIMGAKTLSFEGDYILVPIIVRGAGYEAEWVSSVTLGKSGEAEGFADAADKVMAEWDKFLESHLTVDVKKALEEGRVKFWVSGFSRAAATANLVAKRLTDIYGKNNAIFAYTFEAPKAGIDEKVLNEPYTYNGQYLNIHNIINLGDIVPYVGPKEMGFKRYGVDHYNPGTALGEVTEDVYKTPIKTTVTTYSDNEELEVGTDEYSQRRKKMLLQLAILDESIIFDDYFSLATVNYIGQVVKTNVIVGPLKEGTKTSAAEWIPLLFEKTCQWALNGTYSLSTVDGDGYGGDYRKFYSSNFEFCDREYATVEDALKQLVQLVFSSERKDEFKKALMYRLMNMKSDGSLMFDFYVNVIDMWRNQAKWRQRLYLNDVWNALTKDMNYPDGTKVPSFTDFVDEDEKDQLKRSTYGLLSFLFLFVSRDYDEHPKSYLEGADTSQVFLGTLIYNLSGMLLNHNPEVCLAWLRTYDSHYEKNDTFKYEDVSVNLVASNPVPERIELSVQKAEGKAYISLTPVMGAVGGVDHYSVNNGAAVYYQIFEDGKPVSDWLLYQDPFVLDVTKEVEYSVQAYATRLAQKGEIVTLDDDQLRGEGLMGTFFGEGVIGTIIVIAVVLLGGGVAVFFAVRKKKKAATAIDDEKTEEAPTTEETTDNEK